MVGNVSPERSSRQSIIRVLYLIVADNIDVVGHVGERRFERSGQHHSIGMVAEVSNSEFPERRGECKIGVQFRIFVFDAGLAALSLGFGSTLSVAHVGLHAETRKGKFLLVGPCSLLLVEQVLHLFRHVDGNVAITAVIAVEGVEDVVGAGRGEQQQCQSCDYA